MTALAKLYDRLTPDERFRAFVSALARRDLQEVDRLNDTCPRKTYVTDDMAYWRAKTDLHDVAVAHKIEVGELEKVLLMAVITILVLEGSEEHETELEAWEEIFCKALKARMGLLEAWGAFYSELGLDPTEVTQAFSLQSNPLIEFVLDALLNTVVLPPEVDKAHVERVLGHLRSFWKARRNSSR
jgi:hypothetical protein